MPFESSDRLVEIGVVGRPHSVGGEIRLFLHNESSCPIERGEEVVVDKDGALAPYVVEEVRRASKFVILRLGTIASREDAGRLTGAKISIRRQRLPEPGPDEFYVCDLIGLEAWDGAVQLGRVSGSREAGGVEVVTIEGEGGALEVPLVGDFVEAIDFTGRRLNLRNTGELPRTPSGRR